MRLVEQGRPVTLYESGPACGGRCRSYFDRELGCRIDNGNHLLLSGNKAAMAYLDRLGTRDTLGGPGAPVFPFMDLATGERWSVRPNAGRLPWWLFVPARGVPGARLRDYAGLLALRTAPPEATVAGVLPHGALFHRLIEPLAVAALNTPADQGSARLFWAVIAQSLALGGAQCIPLFPIEGLSESFVDPAVQWMTARGIVPRTGCRIAGIETSQDRVTALVGPDGNHPVAPGEAVVLAVPAPVAATLLPGLETPDAHEAILNLHFKAEAERGEAGFIGLIGGLAEWIFVKRGIVSVTISAANRLLERSGEELAATVWREVCRALAIVTPLPQWRLIREKRATFSATPMQQLRRSSATNHLQNLILAGDWTDTGLPATIEGAIRSGFVAAQQLRAA
jgi:squalene-associated FAD-dependent desaturase